MDRLAEIGFGEEQPDAVQEHARDGVVIAFAVAVYAANALIVAADEAGKLGLEVNLRMAKNEVGRRGEMRFVGPFLARQIAREEAFADALNVGIGGE